MSKELKLEDILSLCAEYEKQIEEEQRQANSLSFTASTPAHSNQEHLNNHNNNNNNNSNNNDSCNDSGNSYYRVGGPRTNSLFSPLNGETLPLSPLLFSPDLPPLSPSAAGPLTSPPSSPWVTEGEGGGPPLSPSSTLQQPRIKTNGSLPREGKPRLPSPSRSLPPTSPPAVGPQQQQQLNFNFDRSSSGGGGTAVATPAGGAFGVPVPPSPGGPVPPSAGGPAAPPSPGCYLTHPPASSSPRTRIRTTIGAATGARLSSSANNGGSRESSVETLRHEELQGGGGGGMASPGIREEGLYYASSGGLGGHYCPPGLQSPLFNTNNSSISADIMPTNFSMADYQGGKEDMAESGGKTQEELYIEARDMLALVGSSPSTTSTRRPPRSKHDGCGEDGMPSREAANRMLIGTVMLGQNRLYGFLDESTASIHSLRAERDETILEVTRTAQVLAEIEHQMDEANRSVDMESSLLDAELTSHHMTLSQLSEDVAALRQRELEAESKLEAWRRGAEQEMEAARGKLREAEANIDRLEAQQRKGGEAVEGEHSGEEKVPEDATDRELEVLERIKLSHEKLEAERRLYEDLEFRQMEYESILEHDREEILKEIVEKEETMRLAEEEIGEMEKQKQEISYSQEGFLMSDQHEAVSCQLRQQQDKLSQLEEKLSQLLTETQQQQQQQHQQLRRRESEDSGTITLSDEETLGCKSEVELGPGGPPPAWEKQLNSAGSGEEDSTTDSTSDLPQDSSSNTPSPNNSQAGKRVRGKKKGGSPTSPSHLAPPTKRLTKRASMQRASDRYLDNLEGLTSADESRPLSSLTSNNSCYLDTSLCLDGGGITDASSWVGEGVVMLRRNAPSRATTRPLTRYLPVAPGDENFDLRSHIESAGHQIELCKHLVVNSCSCRGYLSKQGARIRVWNKRWFVFDRNKRTLVYYSDKSENKAKGGIYFHSISEVYVDHQTNRTASERLTFCMKTQERSYLLMAPSPEAMRIWVDVLFTGAEGYREFQA